MAHCANNYRRHQYKNGRCKRCDCLQVEQLRALANRRAKRHAARAEARRLKQQPLIVTG